ncbi:hypothetical protein [Pseudomonas mosselii]|uniref:hypothetical protein n=1 Tax=Pseudomonas mosselii TaxID=78327 RepID=UPI001BD2676F|nr:hypothetical protein [Pseudomonas mosselii]MBS9759828.1 hypothetical protein [Pseudomonas mosselii]
MTALSAPSIGFRFGYALGTLTREFLRAMKRQAPVVPVQIRPVAQHASIAPTRRDWDELCRIPTLARRGVDLNHWFETNTKPVLVKRRTRQRKPTQRNATNMRMGPLDELIAPVAAL